MTEQTFSPLQHYSRALDEVYCLRVQLASELEEIQRFLRYASLPLAVRKGLIEQQGRVEQVLRRGALSTTRRFIPPGRAQQLLREAGTRPTLTRGAWENGSYLNGD